MGCLKNLLAMNATGMRLPPHPHPHRLRQPQAVLQAAHQAVPQPYKEAICQKSWA